MSSAPKFELPRDDQRTVIVGRTGSGKTQFGTWLLSRVDFHKMPWIIVDYKHDALLNAVDRIKEIGLKEKIPDEPGLYKVHPHPSETEEVNDFLTNVWAHENVGMYFDEMYMIPDSNPFRALMTQGRSKRIPVISLTQRPAWISKFTFTESEHVVIFHLQNKSDHKRVGEFVPDDRGLDLSDRLPPYHARWYSVPADHIWTFKPVPGADELAETIDERLKALQPVRTWW